ncbi:extracellular solute-binding protein [Paenibacillus sp. LHD-117]|uniref:extracellular solute-binding protein n=1 Tax=Paenibacillus sp. LHD-117 TaxID=3071412 RepID=UPI0027DF9A0B|nr:extracellular solute-binding protein [Paenibacillus sp. LHD-117]MDQ6419403.1 extracellular solute-binding protein [Paenibacillus sp. LHD-117]
MISRKKLTASIVVPVLAVSMLAGCGNNGSADTGGAEAVDGNAGGSGVTTEFSFYFSGSQNVKELWDTLIPMFEKQNPNVKVKEVYLPSGTAAQPTLDRLIAAKQAGKGSGDIDLYEGGLGDVSKGQKEELWDTLSNESIPNLEHVDVKTLENVGNQAIPYRASAVVLAYNGDVVKDAPSTLDELYDWIRNHPGKFAYNDPSTGGAGDSFVQSAVYNFLPEGSTSNSDPSIMSQWDEGFQLLKELGPNVYGKGIYPKKNQGTLDLLARGEVDMIPAWSDMGLEQIDKGLLPKSTVLKQLNPGFNGGPTYLMVPALSEKKEAVAEFLDFILTPEAQSVIVRKMHGFPGIKMSDMPQEIQDEFKGVAEGYRTFNLGDLSKELQKRWQSDVAAQ